MSEREQKIKAGIRKGINLVKAGKLNDQDDPYMVVAGFAIEQVPDVSFGEITSAIQEMRAAHEWTANMLGRLLGPSSTVSELLVGPSLRKALIWRAFIFGGTDSKRARDAK
jgi:hypothetical protein